MTTFFRDWLKKEGYNPRYLSREFLAKFIHCYNQSMEAGRPMYEDVFTTKFYRENSSCYCRFLELWNEYKKSMAYAKSIGF